MKKIFSFLALFLVFSSCCNTCKGPAVAAGLGVTYQNLGGSKELMVIETERNDLSMMLDTSSYGELNSYNSYTAHIGFSENSPNYILYFEGTSYQDTISNISFEEDECKNTIVNFCYKLNGELKTENRISL